MIIAIITKNRQDEKPVVKDLASFERGVSECESVYTIGM
jgi:hypothetical protein